MEDGQLFPERDEPLDPEQQEKLREENELLKMKIQAQFGGMSGAAGDIPPEIENEFLKNVIAFEEQYTKTEHNPVKVSLSLGNPIFKKSEEMDDEEFEKEWYRLQQLLEEKGIGVDFIRKRDNRFQYKFITEELFDHESDGSLIMPGMNWNFIYEEFHPDHEQEITDRTMEFLGGWFERDVEKMKFGVVSHFIQPDETILNQEEILNKIQLVFDSYRSFEDCKYHIFEVKFELHESSDDKMQGIGHCEGMVKYDAILENGERKTIEGPFKLYMTRDYDWWSIFYFVMTGFDN
jgi:hypothetical protein